MGDPQVVEAPAQAPRTPYKRSAYPKIGFPLPWWGLDPQNTAMTAGAAGLILANAMRIRGTRRKTEATLPTRCRVRRLQLGWSQEKLAQLANIPQSYVSFIERRRNIVQQEDLEAVGKVLDLDPNCLMDVVEGVT